MGGKSEKVWRNFKEKHVVDSNLTLTDSDFGVVGRWAELPMVGAVSLYCADGGEAASCQGTRCARGGYCIVTRDNVPACQCHLTTFTGPACEDGE